MSQRDNFSAKTIRILQSRVACRCSNPECRKPTIGPALEEDRSVNVGVAAHITAAAEGGPRYDIRLKPEDRKAGENGIWLCQICAKLIDSDVSRFTTDILRGWKKQAVERAFKDVVTSGRSDFTPRPRFDSDQADLDFLNKLDLPTGDTIEAVFDRAAIAAANDIAAFRNAREWPSHTIALNLTARETAASVSVDLNGLAKAVGVVDSLSLISSPGTGKSTTLVQLAERIAAAREFVPLLIPLGEWLDRTDFFDLMIRRNAFGLFRRQHLMQLAYHGRLVLILDGWNELDPQSRIRARVVLQAMQRDYPQLGLVIGTRRQAIPIAGTTIIEIEQLTADQQQEIARAQRGAEGETLVDQAWRTAGVRELVAIPLYLNALLAIPTGPLFPKTKEEILRMFVNEHEQVPETAEILRKELHGFHSEILIGLAEAANRAANTSIQETSARQAISAVGRQLASDGQLTSIPQPTTVIDVLVGSHILIQPSAAGLVKFQHPQFQEWYASYEVEKRMAAVADGDAEALKKLREEILDLPAWEESILFACERLSRTDPAGATAVASAVTEAMGIDPMLAAEMIRRSTVNVWEGVKDAALALVERWHTPGTVDRAVRFMITTGQPAFADRIWPLLPVYPSAILAAERFHPSVLGSNARSKIAALHDGVRPHVVEKIMSHGGYDGIELAAELAKTDPNPAIVVYIIQVLQFGHAGRYVTEILKVAPESVWSELAHQDYPERLNDPVQLQRLSELRKQISPALRDPIHRLDALTSGLFPQDAATLHEVAEIIRTPDFPVRDNNARHALRRTYEVFPGAVAEGLTARMEAGLEIPDDGYKYVGGATPVEAGPIVTLAMNSEAPPRTRIAALAMLGPQAVGNLMDQLFALHDAVIGMDWYSSREEWRRHDDLIGAIKVSRLESFLEALGRRAKTNDPLRIELMADLLARNGTPPYGERFRLAGNAKLALTAIAHRWIDTLLSSPRANRHPLSKTASALSRFVDPEFVPKLKVMLDLDLSEWKHDPLRFDVSEYRDAFIAVGDDTAMTPLMIPYLVHPQFGLEAARVLATRWRNAHPLDPGQELLSALNFRGAAQNRALRLEPRATLPTSDAAEAIFAAVRELMISAGSDDERRHAIGLAQIGLSIPHGSKREVIDALMNLPLPYLSKQNLLTAAAEAGEILSSSALLAALRELVEASGKHPLRLRPNRYEVEKWLVLFAFSDRPRTLVEAVELLSDDYRDLLPGVLQTISASPHPEILQTLADLAKLDSSLTRGYAWYDALVKLGTEAAALFLLDRIGDGTVAGEGRGRSWQMAKDLARFTEDYPNFRRELAQRYACAEDGEIRDLLEETLATTPDQDAVLSMIEAFARDGRAFLGSNLQTAIRNLAVGRRPADHSPFAFEEFSVSLADLRKKLFQLTMAHEQQASLARACLNCIEELRDEHGRINDEARHPDIRAGGRWP